MHDAPATLRFVVLESERYDWLALVPAELNDPEVVALLLRNQQEESILTRKLADGSLVLAGHFTEHGLFAAALVAQTSKSRRSRSATR